METLVLDDMWDVDVAVARLAYGETLRVEVGEEQGPRGPEPKVELLRVLLDTVQQSHRVGQLRYVPHPWVSSRYLRSCVIAPPTSRVGGTGRSGRTESRIPGPSRSSTLSDRDD